MAEATLKLLNEDGKTTPLSLGARPISEYTDYYAIPILYLSGNAAGMTKDNKVTLNYIFKDFSGTCTLKWQGSSSSKLPKKNYTITLDTPVEIVTGWGAQKKYCLKANYVDSSHARNVVCAKLWGQMVKSRTIANERLNALPNGGAVDGFPIIISLNGYFHGLYTWNIPKDAWMFGMDGTGQQAILCAERDNNNKATLFKGLATFVEDPNTGEPDFSVEYSSDDQTGWVLESVNRLITAVMNSDGTNIENDIAPYLDLDSAIDYYIHAVLTANYDGRHRNYLLSTYDGVKWFFTGYDMDVVLGLRAMGAYFYPAYQDMTFEGLASNHALFGLIWKHMRPQLIARYKELRASVMSVENVANLFTDFVADIPLLVYADDFRLWNDIPSTSANNIAHIITYYDLRCRNADKWIGSDSGGSLTEADKAEMVEDVTAALKTAALEPAEEDIPKIFYGGDLPQSKVDAVMPFRYISKTQDISGYCETKAQGNSSLSFPKKNQTTKLYTDADCTEKLKVNFKGWGEQNKFVLKANWIDLSHARNVVSARLWADIVKSRANYAELPELLKTSPNQGAVDGFPVKVYANGIYQGRYTLNIPKDKWAFNMNDELETHCILCGENYLSACFRATATINGFDWTDELHDTVPDAIKTRWNEVISFVMDSTDAEFVANLDNYIDVESAIDYYIFALVSCGLDSMGKNQIYLTYDGLKWYASMYDMDSTWGLYYDGGHFVSAEYAMQDDYESMVGSREGNLLYLRLEQLFMPQIKARYEALRNGALSEASIINRFERFTDICPNDLMKEDYAATTGGGAFIGIPSQNTNNIQQIRQYLHDRLMYSDECIIYAGMHKVTNSLQYCITNNQTAYVAPGGSYTATLTPDDGYQINSVTVTMGGANVTSSAYSNGTINIASVTGDVTITAVCVEIPEYTYTNKVPSSIDTDGSVFNGVGYYDGQELSGSKGTQRAGTNTTVTGFIPVKRGDTIRIKGCAWENAVKPNYIVAYDSTFAHWGTTTSGGSHYYGTANGNGTTKLEQTMTVATEAGGVNTIKLQDADSHNNVAYIRVSCQGDGSITVNGANLIVTVNEEIT